MPAPSSAELSETSSEAIDLDFTTLAIPSSAQMPATIRRASPSSAAKCTIVPLVSA